MLATDFHSKLERYSKSLTSDMIEAPNTGGPGSLPLKQDGVVTDGSYEIIGSQGRIIFLGGATTARTPTGSSKTSVPPPRRSDSAATRHAGFLDRGFAGTPRLPTAAAGSRTGVATTGDTLDRVDRSLGRALDRAVSAHHRRRLRRVGWEHALDGGAGGWADGWAPPRAGNRLEVLVDGAEALPRMVAELERARSHVHLAGWYFSPEFALTRGPRPTVLRNLLAEMAEQVDVRVLAWAGAPLPLFRPSRRQVRAMRDEQAPGTSPIGGRSRGRTRRPRSVLLSESEAQATQHAHDAEPD